MKKAQSGIGSGASTAGSKLRSGIGRGIGGGSSGIGQISRTNSQYAAGNISSHQNLHQYQDQEGAHHQTSVGPTFAE